MTIHHIYCDSAAASGGSGTKTLPFNTLAPIANIVAASGDTRFIHVKSGSVFRGERFPGTLGSVVGRNFWADVYGGSTKPIIDASVPVSSGTWILNATHGFYTATLGTNVFPDVATRLTIGAVFEDGVPLRMELFNSDLAAMSSELTGGAYAEDWTNGVTYMKPRSGTPSSHTYSVATHAYVITATQTGAYPLPEPGAPWHIGPRNEDTPDGRDWSFSFEGLRLIGGKWGGIGIERGPTRVVDVEIYGCGGVQWQAYATPHAGNSSHLGNGIGISNGARRVLVENCKVEQVFDAGISPQAFSTGDTVSDVIMRNNFIKACGFYGIEISVHGTGAAVRNITAENNTVTRAQDCFGYPIHVGRFRGFSIIYNGSSNVLDNIVVRNNTVADMEDTFASGTGASAYVITEGTGIDVSNNIAFNIERYGAYIPVGVGPTFADLILRKNIFNGCDIASILVNSTITAAQITLEGNESYNTPIDFQDTSSANTPVKLVQNEFNGTDAVDASRTTGITGYGNTAAGTITGYEYLF